jgi:TRAP-type C4-dicarboxylate transport system substrate-binding protein
VGQERGRRLRPDIEIDHIADKKPFQDAVKPVWDKYGSKFTDLIKQIQAVS